MGDDGFDIALAFDTDDPEFARGVEVGILWERLREEWFDFEMSMHAASSEMVARIVLSQGREFRVVYEDDGHWMNVWIGHRVSEEIA